MRDQLRIGMVNFINTAPMYFTWQERGNNSRWQVVEAVPSKLNRLLDDGELDLGIVSSHEYALHPDKYYVLDNLSISSSGAVGSVYLFADCPLSELARKKVLLSPQSQTSNSLVRIILENFLEIRPQYLLAPEKEPEAPAKVAIGDEALRLYGAHRYPTVLDLGQAWLDLTGLPFVFAVWAVRREAWEQRKEDILAIQQELFSCVEEGHRNLPVIAAKAAPRIPMEPASCERYLAGIEYDLAAAKKEGLQHFYKLLIERREVPGSALPVNYCG
ncbi:MAG: menaquinone biosynthesis protein [Deltaproteobacteria bacterium]